MIWCRQMIFADLNPVAALEKDSFSEPWSRDSFAKALESEDYCYYAAIRPEDGFLAGYAGYLRSFEEACITNMAVAPALRGQGIGSLLLGELLKHGREQGIERFTLEVRMSNAAAIRLYEKSGFHTVGIRKGFYSFPREDACIMWTDETDGYYSQPNRAPAARLRQKTYRQ